MNVILDVVSSLLLLSLVITIYRLVRGPTLADRGVAADQVALHVVALTVVYSVSSQQPELIDLVIVTAIVGFLSMAVIGIYIERGVHGKARIEPGD